MNTNKTYILRLAMLTIYILYIGIIVEISLCADPDNGAISSPSTQVEESKGIYKVLHNGTIPGTFHPEKIVVHTATGSSIDTIRSLSPTDDHERTDVDHSKLHVVSLYDGDQSEFSMSDKKVPQIKVPPNEHQSELPEIQSGLTTKLSNAKNLYFWESGQDGQVYFFLATFLLFAFFIPSIGSQKSE
jgi:hypothetical protein